MKLTWASQAAQPKGQKFRIKEKMSPTGRRWGSVNLCVRHHDDDDIPLAPCGVVCSVCPDIYPAARQCTWSHSQGPTVHGGIHSCPPENMHSRISPRSCCTGATTETSGHAKSQVMAIQDYCNKNNISSLQKNLLQKSNIFLHCKQESRHCLTLVHVE